MSIMESSSARSRFMAESGIKVLSTNKGSSYILVARLRRIIKAEVTLELFDEIKLKFYGKNTRIRRDVFVDRLLTKIETLTFEMLQYVSFVHSEFGIKETCRVLKLSLMKLKKLSKVDEETIDDDTEEDLNEDNVLLDEQVWTD